MINETPLWYAKLAKSLESARHQPESRYLQLATVSEDGSPNVRTVVYRGFNEQRDALFIVTDTRSAKISELAALPKACVCWYFARSREQFRLYSDASIHLITQNSELVQSHWQRMSDAGKRQFLWGEPGAPLAEERGLRIDVIPDEAPAHFCVLSLRINRVDYLTLRGAPQHREIHWREQQQWRFRVVTP